MSGECPMCGEYLHEDAPSALVGEDTVHDYCADYGEVTKCILCGVLEYNDCVDATWGYDGRTDRMCPDCTKDRADEDAAEALARAAPADRRNPLIDMLEAIITDTQKP